MHRWVRAARLTTNKTLGSLKAPPPTELILTLPPQARGRARSRCAASDSIAILCILSAAAHLCSANFACFFRYSRFRSSPPMRMNAHRAYDFTSPLSMLSISLLLPIRGVTSFPGLLAFPLSTGLCQLISVNGFPHACISIAPPLPSHLPSCIHVHLRLARRR